MSRYAPCLTLLLSALTLQLTSPAFAQEDEGGIASAVTNAFTYQGELKQGGGLVNGTAEFHFRLYDTLAGGAQVGPELVFEGVNAVAVSNGRFTVQLNFGAGVFNGQARWLEIDTRTVPGPYITLNTRQPLTAVPYALYALNGTGLAVPYSTTTSNAGPLFTVNNSGSGAAMRLTGNASSGFPFAVLHVDGGNANRGIYAYDVTGDAIVGDSWSGNAVFGYSGNTGRAFYGYSQNGTAVHAVNGATTNYALLAHPDYGVDGVVAGNEDTGVRGYHGLTGNNGRLGTAGYGVRGEHAATGNDGHLGTATAGVSGMGFGNGAGVRGQHTPTGAYGELGSFPNQFGVGVYGNAQAGSFAGLFQGQVDVNGTLIADRIVTEQNTSAASSFNRLGDDGVVVEIRQAGIIEGTISVSGTTVSYNAFTGSHFGWTDEEIERGTLVSLTGHNRHSHNNPNAEVIYGISPSLSANDSKCMGAYLSLQEPSQQQSNDNPYLIMAVGNGDMWVAESAIGDIQPGDFLISSDVTGCAMKDDSQRFPIGYIIARSGEGIDWSTVEADTNGIKRKKISVFFESFVRNSEAAGLAETVAAQQHEIDSLKAQLTTLTSIAQRVTQLETERLASAPSSGNQIGVHP